MKHRWSITLFFGLCVLAGWFLYLDRGILTPFIVAGIFAYLCNPIVTLFMRVFRIHRTFAVMLLYLLFFLLLFLIGFTATKQLFVESVELQRYVSRLTIVTRKELATAPIWIRDAVNDTLVSIQTSEYLSPRVIFILFPQAISRVLSFILFIVAGFFFLKDGRNMIDTVVGYVPKSYQKDTLEFLKRVNVILNSYLRGQLLLIAWVSGVLFIGLTILGVRFALLIAVFSGFAEIIPFIGPIVATIVAVIIVLITGSLNFSISALNGALIVMVLFTVVRQLQDYIVTPYVMQRVTNLHPLIILFAVLSGEHLFGILGLLLAIPVVATMKLFLEYVRGWLAEDKKLSRERNKPDSVHPAVKRD